MKISWEFLPGGQYHFLSSDSDICLLHGDRGGGKTETLIVDFLADVGQGFGRNWKGILFRKTFPALEEVIDKCHILIPRAFPDAIYLKGSKTWKFKTGETLKLRVLQYKQDYDKYHGHQYSWIGLDELTKWAGDWIMQVVSLNRGPLGLGIFYRTRATTNPDGLGHGWVKKLFIDPAKSTVQFEREGLKYENVFVSFKDNPYLNKKYINAIMAACQGNENLKKAWIDGSWDIIAGGFFIDVWKSEKHIIEDIDFAGIDLYRTFDWGSSKPFSVGYFISTRGESLKTLSGKVLNLPSNSIIRVKEYYGCSKDKDDTGLRLTASEIGENIISFEETILKGANIIPGPADNAIYNDTGMNSSTGSRSIGDVLEEYGVYFEKSDKTPGSRKTGNELMRALLKETLKDNPEKPCFYVCESCRDFIRTIPVLPRDEKKIDDIDTSSEDHIWDETRYFILSQNLNEIKHEKLRGY